MMMMMTTRMSMIWEFFKDENEM